MRLPARVPILYLILGVLILVGVVPLYIYGTKVVDINRDRLITNERLLQNTVTRSLAEDIAQRHKNMQASLGNLSSAVLAASGGDISGEHVNAPELAKLLESFVSSTDSVLYVTLVNEEASWLSLEASKIKSSPRCNGCSNTLPPKTATAFCALRIGPRVMALN